MWRKDNKNSELVLMKWQTKEIVGGGLGGGGEALACERDIPRERRRTTPSHSRG